MESLSRKRARAGRAGARATHSRYSPEELGERVREGQLRRFIAQTPEDLPLAERRRRAKWLRRQWFAEISARRKEKSA
jgi:hypothetical protein